MIDAERDHLRESLYKVCNPYMHYGRYYTLDEMPDELSNEWDRLRTIEMLSGMADSKIAYGRPVTADNWENVLEELCQDNYICENYNVLSDKEKREVIEAQVQEYRDNLTIKHDVYTDNEGVSYNASVVSPDRKVPAHTKKTMAEVELFVQKAL